jgi:hypothetical protein
MSETIVQLITIYCDIPRCNNEIACGNDTQYAEKNGWKEDQIVLETHYDHICPDCIADLEAFICESIPNLLENPDFDIPIPEMDLKAVNAGEQKRAEYDE